MVISVQIARLLTTHNPQGVIIVDAGGGTIDVSTYKGTASNEGKATFEEIAVSQCPRFISVFYVIRH